MNIDGDNIINMYQIYHYMYVCMYVFHPILPTDKLIHASKGTHHMCNGALGCCTMISRNSSHFVHNSPSNC